MHYWTFFILIASLSYALGNCESKTEITEIGDCTYFKKAFNGTLLEDQPKFKKFNYKGCRKICIKSDGCNYWTYVNRKDPNVTLQRTCILYSAIGIIISYPNSKSKFFFNFLASTIGFGNECR